MHANARQMQAYAQAEHIVVQSSSSRGVLADGCLGGQHTMQLPSQHPADPCKT